MSKRITKMKKRKVRFYRMNWDAQFYKDICDGNGFIISEPAEVAFEGRKKKALYGAQSPLYGTSYDDEQAFAERYRCECGTIKGREFEHEICPVCGKPVEYKDSNINVTGWITLGDNKVISPYYYKLFSNAIGKVFPDIVHGMFKVDKNGNVSKLTEDDDEITRTSPFFGIGVDEFYDRYEEILTYYKETKKSKASTFDLLLKQKRNAFISHIPIASTMLRPQSSTQDTLYFNSIDKIINTLYSLSENVKNCIDVERDYILWRIQTKVNSMWDKYFETLNSKEGFIRGEIMGGSLNFTSRNVIVPDPTLKDDGVDLSYHTFLEMYKYKIIYYLMKIEDINLSKAYGIWKASSSYNEKVYQVMQLIIKNEDVRVLINRNPTLNYYSMLLMHIRKVKPDGNDYSLSIPLSINKSGKVESLINLSNCGNELVKYLIY